MSTETAPGDGAQHESEQVPPASRLTPLKAALVEEAIAQAPPDERALLERLLASYVRHVAAEDLEGRSAHDLAGALDSHLALARSLPQGTAQVRILTPTSSADGWSAGGRSVVEIVVDDMPYLVDSVSMELARQRHDVHLVIHPVFDVVRDVTGAMQDVAAVADGSAEPTGGAVRESWMHVEVDRIPEARAQETVAGLLRVLQDVREAVEDTPKLLQRVSDIVAELRSTPPATVAPEEAAESASLLAWLADDHFTFLGYREYRLAADPDDPTGPDAEPTLLQGVPGTGLGILRADPILEPGRGRMPAPVRARARDRTVLVLAKSNSRATVSQPAYLDHVGVKLFDETGEVVGERRFLGLFTTKASRESITRIPVLRLKVAEVLRRSGFDERSHTGKALLDTLETYPREELFHATVDELAPMAEVVMGAGERRTLRVVVRPDTYGRYVSVLVTLPRDRYNTTVRERFSQILIEELGGTDVEFTVRIGELTTARVHFVVHVPPGSLERLDVSTLEARLQAASRSWRDDLVSAVIGKHGEDGAARLAALLDAFPEAYKEDFPAEVGATDLDRLQRLTASADPVLGGVDFSVDAAPGGPVDEARLKVYRVGDPLSLSHVLPMLASLGVEVTDERPYDLDGTDRSTHIYEFGLRYAGERFPLDRSDDLRDALAELWSGRSEVDGFNALVLAAGLDHRQVTVLRAYAKYLRQGATPFTRATIERAMRSNVEITRLLVRLFEERFDPAGPAPEIRAEREDAIADQITAALDDVASLDQDRILRSYLAHIRATLRTNHWQRSPDGAPKDYLSLKLEPTLLPDLPQPRPAYEIFVYSPRVEGVHLRFGAVARGGLRWSDRRDDFRTEILGLVKAQMVKNTVIVPVGAKGGFVPKRLPDPSVDRDAWFAEGKAAYVTFIRGLLDVTDNLVAGADGQQRTVPPADVVRHDGDDSYLVVAADKGTATFSDLANEVARSYGFWLGDAFASGGSVGYDHKAMGITARGAWVSVQRHFKELGVDTQSQDFTVVGIGDMSGDVFGNGMLLSPHIRLVAAFDHRDIFIDPDPDAASSFAERQRLFALARSSWQDYDRSLISEGGGIWSRQLKAVPLNDAVRTALGIDAGIAAMTPAELISAILRAPVDLLWNGGIGTYVKASHEPHAAAGDKTNDAVRVDGRDLRARAVGEGGNLGFTQAGRVEYALHGAGGAGGRINTDAIDNSAGVDTSDHEVNLKILLDREVAAGRLTEAERGELLGEMTDEVADLVLVDNEEQNLALADAAAHARSLLHIHEDQMARLEERGVLDRAVEGLPSSAEVRRRIEAKGALTAPEHAVLMSWTKIELARELIETGLPDEPYVARRLPDYFPSLVRERFAAAVRAHPLRREIIVTQLVNEVVNHAGKTFWLRLSEETGASAADLVRAHLVAREVLGADPLLERVRALDHVVDAGLQTRLRVDVRTAVERATRWLVEQRSGEDGDTLVSRFSGPVQAVLGSMPELLEGTAAQAYAERRAALLADGVPEELAGAVAQLPTAYVLLGVVDVAHRQGLDPVEVTRVHLAVGERLALPTVLARIQALPRHDTWGSLARTAIRDDLHAAHAELTLRALHDPLWLDSDAVGHAAATLAQIVADPKADLARLSVGLRVVRSLLT